MEAMDATEIGGRVLEAKAIRFPTWVEFIDAHLLWPFIVQLMLTLAFNVLSVFYGHAYNKRGKIYRFVHAYIGTLENMRVSHPFFIVVCYILQLVLSICSVCMFAGRTYTHEVSELGHILELAMCSFFALHYFATRMQAGFSPSSAWSPCALIDVVTVVPVLLPFMVGIKPVAPHVRWLSLSYLRSYRALTAYQRLERTVGLGEVSEFYRRLLLSFLRTAAMVICMGCTILILEVLGEIPGCEDRFIKTEMGELSFVQMIYWMFTTISTVGYGDFSPTTAPARLFIIAFIVGGVAFFGGELEGLLEVRSLLHNHQGRYVPRDREAMHIVALGPGVSLFSPTMEAFLGEMLDTERGILAPDVVLLSDEPFDDELIRFVRTELPPKVRRNVHFLVGSAMLQRDLARVRLRQCAMAFIIPNPAALAFVEDGHNILRAIELKRYCPRVQLRLMLLQPESKMRAMNIGIEQEFCFSAFEQKINLLAQSTRVKGFLPLVIGMLQVMTQFDYKEAVHHVQAKDKDWMPLYLASLRNATYGFVIGCSLVGLRFEEAAAKVYQESNGQVLMIAVQHAGRLALNFEGYLVKGQVVISIACSRQACMPFADRSVDWRIEFLQRREDGLHGGSSGLSGGPSRVIGLSSLKQQDAEPDEYSNLARAPRRLTRSQTEKSTASQRNMRRLLSENSNFGDDENEELMDRRLRDSKEAQQLLSDPCLITLVVAGGSVWPQVVAFLRTLRQPFLPNHQPVIILSAVPPPASVVETFESVRTVFLVGPVLRVHNLLEAGVRQAQTIVVLGGEQRAENPSPTPAAAVLMDHDVVLLANTVEQLLRGAGGDHFAIYEFTSTNAVRLVEHAHSGNCHVRPSLQRLKSTLPQHRSSPSRDDLSLVQHASRRWHRMVSPLWRIGLIAKNIFVDLFSNTDIADRDREDDGEQDSDAASTLSRKLSFQRWFAAGRALTVDFFGSALGHIYHFPPSIELMEALTMPARRGQAAYPWQVRCPPEWVGQTFGELLRAWLLGDDPAIAEVGVVTVLALYRQRSFTAPDAVEQRPSGGSNAAGYNMTLPPHATPLLDTDQITVLAGQQFGRTMARRGLLRGAETMVEPAGAAAQLPHNFSVSSMVIPESPHSSQGSAGQQGFAVRI